MKIILYEDKYKEEMISMVYEAKAALRRTPSINEDLLDVKKNYLDKGGAFYLALDNETVVGCGGFSRMGKTNEAFLHRLYIKADKKRMGIGSLLLKTLEADMIEKGIKISRVHLGDKKVYFESYSFYPKNGYKKYDDDHMLKEL